MESRVSRALSALCGAAALVAALLDVRTGCGNVVPTRAGRKQNLPPAAVPPMAFLSVYDFCCWLSFILKGSAQVQE